jgi:hypothetical protein
MTFPRIRKDRAFCWPRAMPELLFPHLRARCGRRVRNPNENNKDFSEWCGREDSNLHGLPR